MAAFLVDASLPRSTGDVLRRHGHLATDVRDIGMADSADDEIADHAQLHQLAMISCDQDFGNVLNYPPAAYHGLIVIRPPEHATIAQFHALIELVLNDGLVMANLPGRLVIVQPASIRCRPPI